MANLTAAVQDVDGHENNAQLYASQIKIDHLDAVDEIHAESITCLEVCRSEPVRHPIAAKIQFTECVGDTREFECNPIAAAS